VTTIAPPPPRVRTRVPSSTDVIETLTGLLGREVTVEPGEPVIPRPATPAAIAVYVDESGSLRSTIVVDLPLAAFVGGGLALVPTEATQAAVEAKALTESMAENLHEIFNVMTSSFNVGATQRVSLQQVVAPGALPPIDVAVQLRILCRRLDLTVNVEGYGSGGLSIVCL
jgi:hypothetical protein